MKKALLLLVLLILLYQAKAQQLIRERVYRVNSLVKGAPISASTREGNVILSGNYIVNSTIQSLIMLIKPNTDTLWIRKGPVLPTGGQAIKQSSGKGFVFYTAKSYTNPPASGTILQNYDANGFLKWTMPYAINNYDAGYLLLQAPDSCYFLGGRNMISGKQKSFTLGRTDSFGNLKWRKSYDWAPPDFLGDIQHTNNGNIVMYGNLGAPQRLKLLLVNQNGDSILGRTLNLFNSTRNERLSSSFSGITPLSDGGFLMAAEIDTNVTGAPPRLGMVVKVNANLQPVWHYVNRALPTMLCLPVLGSLLMVH